jgi:hypothetical protein
MDGGASFSCGRSPPAFLGLELGGPEIMNGAKWFAIVILWLGISLGVWALASAAIASPGMPDRLRDTVTRRFPASRIVDVDLDREDGQTVYEVKLLEVRDKARHRRLKLHVTSGAQIVRVERELSEAEVPPPVLRSIDVRFPQSSLVTATEITRHEAHVWYKLRILTKSGGRLDVECSPQGDVLDVDD